MMSSKISSKVLKKNVPMVLHILLLTAEGNFCYLMRVFLRFIKHLSGLSAIDTSKYSRHSRTFVDQVLEVDKYKTYSYVCNCHGSICQNERKLEIRSTGWPRFI